MALSRGTPAKLPEFTWSGDPKVWSGLPIKYSDAPDLPIAYLPENFPLEGYINVLAVGTGGPGQGKPLRRPNVLVFGGIDQAVEFLAAGLDDRINAAGLLVGYILTPPLTDPDDYDTLFRMLLSGLPALGVDSVAFGPAGELKEPDTYLGGRLLIVQRDDGPRYADSYLNLSLDAPATYVAIPGTDFECGQVAGPVIGGESHYYKAGTGEMEAPNTAGIFGFEGLILVNGGPRGDMVSADQQFLALAAERFEKVTVAVGALVFPENTPDTVKAMMVCGLYKSEDDSYVRDDLVPSVQGHAASPSLGNTPFVSQFNDAQVEAIGLHLGPNVIRAEGLTHEDMMAYFED